MNAHKHKYKIESTGPGWITRYLFQCSICHRWVAVSKMYFWVGPIRHPAAPRS